MSFTPKRGVPSSYPRFPTRQRRRIITTRHRARPLGKRSSTLCKSGLRTRSVPFSKTSDSFSTPQQDYETCVVLPQYQSVAANGILLTNYNAITHPSEPNYVAASAGSNLGITNDDYYDIPADEKSIFDLLEAKGLKWKSYNEEIPAPGWTGYSAYGGAYVRKHNPAIIFDNIGLNQTRSANVVSGERAGGFQCTKTKLTPPRSHPPHERHRQEEHARVFVLHAKHYQ